MHCRTQWQENKPQFTRWRYVTVPVYVPDNGSNWWSAKVPTQNRLWPRRIPCIHSITWYFKVITWIYTCNQGGLNLLDATEGQCRHFAELHWTFISLGLKLSLFSGSRHSKAAGTKKSRDPYPTQRPQCKLIHISGTNQVLSTSLCWTRDGSHHGLSCVSICLYLYPYSHTY